MKRVICLCLTLMLTLSLMPAPVRAAGVICQPGETIGVIFTLSEDGDQPDGVMGRLSFDTDIFTLLPSKEVIGMDGINILNRQPVTLSFRVNKFAPAGQYTIEARVIEAYDADGKEYTNARINPVQVTVMSAATATPEQTPVPTPTDKPLSSAEGTSSKKTKAGDYVTFGWYPQTAEGNDQTPIEWLVLEVQGTKALLLSRYGLDLKPYNTEYTDITWEKCTLRTWLNGEFLNKAFSSTEQKAILTTAVDNSSSQGYSGWSASGGNNTKDKIFLLSYGEANKYLGVTREDISNKKSRTSPTAYAQQAGAWTNGSYKTADGKAAGWWWLRSPGYYQYSAAFVYTDGSLYNRYVNLDYAVVRPALWINLDSGIF